MLSNFLKNLSILRKFLFINFFIFIIIGLITILYLKLLLYFSVNNNKENMPTANARNDPLEKVKSKFINESIRRNVFVLFSIKYFRKSSAANNL